jgi:hypothetical protein
MAKTTERAETTEAQGSIVRRTREEGIAKILEPAAASGEGSRLMLFGRTRMGKTKLAISILDEMLARGIAQTVIIHDPKYPTVQQYPGAPVRTEIEMREALLTSSVVVCRPPFSAASAAEHARRLIEQCGEATAILVDETRRALGKNQAFIDDQGPDGKGPGPKNFEWMLLEAGGLRGSVVLLVQIPKRSPGEALDSAQFSVVLGVGGRSLNYLTDTAKIVPLDAVDTVKALQPGEFCVFNDDSDWDRTIYYSPLPAGG